MAVEIKSWINYLPDVTMTELYETLCEAACWGWRVRWLDEAAEYDQAIIWFVGDGTNDEIEAAYHKCFPQ